MLRSSVNFKNQAEKSTQVVARLIQQSGGPTDYLRLVKLAYLAERESILSRGVPIIGGHYFSMRQGPTIGEVMNFVHQRNAPQWKETISIRFGNEVHLEKVAPSYSALSKAELDILDSTVSNHLQRTTEELVEWCHLNCPEYEKVEGRDRRPIDAESILLKAKKSEKCIIRFLENAKMDEDIEAILA